MQNTTLGNRLKLFRSKLGITQAQLADIIGKGISAVQKYEQGQRNMEESVLFLLKSNYGLNVDWLINGNGKMFEHDNIQNKAVYRLTVYDHYNKTSKELFQENNIIGIYDIAQEHLHLNFKDAFMLHIKDNDLAPTLENGDYIALERKVTDKEDGKLYLCSINSKLSIKTLYFQDENIAYNENNKPFIVPANQIKIIGKVIWISRIID